MGDVECHNPMPNAPKKEIINNEPEAEEKFSGASAGLLGKKV